MMSSAARDSGTKLARFVLYRSAGIAQIPSASISLRRISATSPRLVQRNLADRRLHQPLERPLVFIRAAEVFPRMSDHKLVQHGRHGLNLRRRCPVVERIFAPVDSLPQRAGLANGMERGPVGI